MRQTRDGAIELVDASPRSPRTATCARSCSGLRWNTALIWYMRTLAWVWVAKGLCSTGRSFLARFPALRRLRGHGAARCRRLSSPSPASIFWRRSGFGLRRPGAARSGSSARWSRRLPRSWPTRGARSATAARSLNVALIAGYFLLSWKAASARRVRPRDSALSSNCFSRARPDREVLVV